MLRVGIYGGSGYTGQELLRILLRHPGVEITAVTSRMYKGRAVADVYPVFKKLTDLAFIDATPAEVAALSDIVFLALPHGEAMAVVPHFYEAGSRIIDLSADFRLRDIGVYTTWYGEHSAPQLIAHAVFGLPELYRDKIRTARLIANPGCYPTSVILGLAPLVADGAVNCSSIVADSKSGVSGAGRNLKLGSLFCEVNEGFKPYSIGSHRHTPEMEQELEGLAGGPVKVLFVPHLLPVSRGILSTLYADLTKALSTAELVDRYREFYRDEPFVRIYEPGSVPTIAAVRGSNYCDIGFALDEKTGKVIVISAIDNLIKGAAGQAVQNMNLMCGFDETAGLDLVSLFP